MASLFKKESIKVKTPRANPLGTQPRVEGFSRVTPPRQKPIKTRIYTKAIAGEDPSKYEDSGFGSTGLTGES